jgi:hypothetical protein
MGKHPEVTNIHRELPEYMAGNTAAIKKHLDASNKLGDKNFKAMRESLKKELLDHSFKVGVRTPGDRFDSINK